MTLLIREIDNFRGDFDAEPVPIAQDLRAGAIAWIVAFAPEAVSGEAQRLIGMTCDAARVLPDYAHYGWYRTVYLDVAQYLITRDTRWLSVLVSNIDHTSSQLRSSLHAPLGLVAPSLNVAWSELKRRIASNLRNAHFYNDSLMCLYCVFQGNSAEKLAQVRHWRQEIKLAPQDVTTLDRLIAGDFLSNALIADEYAQIARYLLGRLMDPNLVSPGLEGEQEVIGARKALTLNTFWRRMASHPLNASLVRLQSR